MSEKVDNETVVINLNDGCYYNLNETATYIWELIGCGVEKGDITKNYSYLFSLDGDKASADVEEVLNLLLHESLIKATDSPSACLKHEPVVFDYIAPEIDKFDDMQEMLLLDPIHEVTEQGWPHKNDK